VTKSVKVSTLPPNTRQTRKSFECGRQLDDFKAPNFNKANQRAHFCPKWLSPFSTILMSTLLEPSLICILFFLLVCCSFPFFLYCSGKKEKEKKSKFSETSHWDTASHREGWVAWRVSHVSYLFCF
jgi:hypothetical protein